MWDSRAAQLSAATLLLFAPLGACADANDLLTLTASVNQNHDDNLFRRPSDGSLGPIASDRIMTTNVGLSLQKPISLQRFELRASVADNRYDRFGALNSRSHNHDAAWRWQLTPHLTGNLTSGRNQSQTDFADFRGAGQNLRTTSSSRFDASLHFGGGWTLGAGATDTKSINSQTFVQDDSSKQRSTDASLRYAFPSGTAIGLTTSKSRGEFQRAADPLNLLDTSFTERRNGIDFSWPLTGKTTLAGQIGRVARKNGTFSVRDYSSGSGSLTLGWKPSGKTSISLAHTQATETFEEVSSSFTRRTGTTLSGTWQIASKVSLRGAISRESRSYEGGGAISAPTARLDRTRADSIAVNWAVHRNLTLSALTQNQRRSSNIVGLEYRANTTGLTASLSF